MVCAEQRINRQRGRPDGNDVMRWKKLLEKIFAP
jgi:hypothetical protein